ncbi:MAG: hypothetical protein QHJ81_14350 [Anaerolineae bacterium]|nr:hypothetical protein [Anaerolineae bacterium]
MEDLEKLGAFYLGKEYDLEKGEILDRPVMYDARDLTTHAVCVGMTGSGKTGLCIDLLEEAALDSVPAIIIDPKGDVTNLLLTFPELRPEDFLPWVNVDDARRKGQSVEAYAESIAGTWRKGLADWGQGPERIRRLKDSAEFLIYTPGSDAGLPVSILHSFAAPTLDWDEHGEMLQEKVQGTVSALLGLAGIQADPVRSREHILLSHIFEQAWRAGEDLDLAKLIGQVQNPPMRKLGVFDLDTFFPQKERFGPAMALNNLIAAPGFGRWLEGQPLEVGELLHGPGGKPRMSVFYIAHLTDAERMFFVTLLLQQVLTWMRAQPGTTSLRALVYFDEVFGYFPPVAEPPSKRPLLTLLKMARAFGLGMVLTTQNPVDVDYKGLTNAGTWFIGKLQTERDKMRVLEGLESTVSEAGTLLDRNYLDRLISSLGSRVFLLHNVHEEKPIVFYTRWAMSYLRGPLTRPQVRELMRGVRAQAVLPEAEMAAVPGAARAAGVEARPTVEALPAGLSAHRPALPPDVEQVFLPTRLSLEQAVRRLEEDLGERLEVRGGQLVYEPALLGMATVRFAERQYDVDERREMALLLKAPASRPLLRWDEAERLDITYRDLVEEPFGEPLFAEVPATVANARKLKKLASDFADALYRQEALVLSYNPALGLHSRPGESPRDFTVRCREAARERRDAEVDRLSRQYEAKIRRLEERLRREERELAEDEAEYAARKRDELVSAGESVLGMFLGRRSSRAISMASTKRRLTAQAKADIEESQATIAELKEDIAKLQEELAQEAEAITSRWADALEKAQEVRVTPRRTDIDVELFALAWAPHWAVTYQDTRGRERSDTVPAYVSD